MDRRTRPLRRREIMKKYSIVLALLVLALVVVALGGCGEDVTETTVGEMEGTSTMSQETTTTMTDTTSTTAPQESTTSTSTATTQDMGGSGIPMAQPGAYTDLTPEQAKQLIDTTPDLVIIDVSPHYDEGHLPGAVSYYLGDGSLEAAIPTLDKDVPYLVYCHVDSVAISGAQALVDAGFAMVYRLEGNYSGWVDAGYPVER
jgi:rhodanese-related sulfurtransferase